jgi:hypothetical protein
MKEHGTRQAVAGLALVELLPSCTAQFGIVDPVERYVEYGPARAKAESAPSAPHNCCAAWQAKNHAAMTGREL